MRNKFVHIAFSVLSIVISAALQDMALPIFGIKPPVILAVTLFTIIKSVADERSQVNFRRVNFKWLFFALIAGAMTDAIGSLPSGCAVGFFLIVSIAVRITSRVLKEVSRVVTGWLALVVATPIFMTWIDVWGVSTYVSDSPFRALLAIVPAALTGFVVFPLMQWIEKAVGLDIKSQGVIS